MTIKHTNYPSLIDFRKFFLVIQNQMTNTTSRGLIGKNTTQFSTAAISNCHVCCDSFDMLHVHQWTIVIMNMAFHSILKFPVVVRGLFMFKLFDCTDVTAVLNYGNGCDITSLKWFMATLMSQLTFILFSEKNWLIFFFQYQMSNRQIQGKKNSLTAKEKFFFKGTKNGSRSSSSNKTQSR